MSRFLKMIGIETVREAQGAGYSGSQVFGVISLFFAFCIIVFLIASLDKLGGTNSGDISAKTIGVSLVAAAVLVLVGLVSCGAV